MYDYIKRAYGKTFKAGQRVRHTVTENAGEVRREDPSQGNYVMVRFDGYKHNLPCHPDELVDI